MNYQTIIVNYDTFVTIIYTEIDNGKRADVNMMNISGILL